MENVETEHTLGSGLGTSAGRVPGEPAEPGKPWKSEGELASTLTPARHGADDVSAYRENIGSQGLSEALDKLLERLPGLFGDERTKAKKEFLELAEKSHSPRLELAAKSAEVARRVTGSVKQEWETRRERADTYVHANPFRSLGIAVGMGVLLGAIGVGSLHRR